ncbi:MAG: aldo/keto reductase [Acidobacteriaceae bacterium]
MVGFGASPLGDVFGVTDPKEGERAVHMAVDEGINLFDVSPYYGLTLAEERLGAALRGRRDRIILSTKCGRYGVDRFDYSARRIAESIEESLRRLQTDHVDLLLAHDIEYGDLSQIIEETIPAMRRLQEQGKARYIGISGYPLRPLVRVVGEAPLDVVLSYCRYNLLADDMDAVLAPVVEHLGAGLINASPLSMGLLTEEGPPGWHPATKETREAAKRAAEYCRGRGANLSELALRFCFDYPRAATTLLGMATREQVRSSLRAFQTPADLELVREVRAIFGNAFNSSWSSGREENQ